MNNNFLQQLMMSGNPQNMLMNMVKNNPNITNNPLYQNALNMMNNGDEKGLESLARNLAKESGVDINQFRNMFR